MRDLLEKIPYEKLWAVPTWQRWLAVCGVLFLFFVIYYFVSYKGSVQEIERLVSERDKIKANFERYVIYVKKMPQLEKEIAKLNKELQKARVQLPGAKEIPELLTLISNTGTQSGLEFLLFKPLPEQKVDFYARVPVEMVIVGSFHNTAIFFDKVKKLSRIVNIANVNVVVKPGKGNLLRTSCSATTYKYLEQAALKTKPIEKK